MKGILKIAFKLLVNDKGKYALLVGITFAVFLMDQIELKNSVMKEGMVTLVYDAHDQVHNQAVVVKRFREKESFGHPERPSRLSQQ